jgi:hypothetical protein
MEQFSPEEIEHMAKLTLGRRASVRKYYLKNREKLIANQKIYYQKWKTDHPDKYDLMKARSIARNKRQRLESETVESDIDLIS